MSKVVPYNTDSFEYPPAHRNVHHDHDDCPDGKKHKETGTGNKLRCDECKKLG